MVGSAASVAASVVVADDSPDLRFLTVHAVNGLDEHEQFDVVEAGDGLQALERVSKLLEAGARVLLLSDHRMPGLTGVEVVDRLRAKYPDAKLDIVMLTSASPPPEIGDKADGLGIRVVERPATIRELRKTLGGVVTAWLDRAPGA